MALALRAPALMLGTAGAYLRTWLRRFDGARPWRFPWRLLTGRARVNGLVIVSHHFMSREEALSPVGQERLGLCVFNVPIGDQLVPMCEINALAAHALSAAGFTEVRNLEGSIFRWANEGHPLVAAGGPVREVHGFGSPWRFLLNPDRRAVR